MKPTLRQKLERIIFESDTPLGRQFDIALIAFIIISVVLVILESVAAINSVIGRELYIAEWIFTLVFTVEYFLRIATVRKPLAYIFSFYGAVDLLAIIPTYLSVLLPGTQSLLIIRVFRLLRIFRIFKLAEYLGEGNMLLNALRASGPKITVFLMVVLSTVLTVGALMYVVEGPNSGFTNIPTGIYWAIVTMTTVGFGDITPQTPLGQFIASCLMIMGYGVIAVPTGVVTTELVLAQRGELGSSTECPSCKKLSSSKARFCQYCGKLKMS